MPAFNFPVQSTPFIGRTGELAQIGALLDNDACRLLTLVGPGGIGKTRLSIEAAQAQASHFADGVYFVSFQPLNRSDDILSTIAQVLDVQFSPNLDARAQLLDVLSSRSALLLFDNVEHLLDGVDLLADLLRVAPGLKLLTTSRERLNLVEEWVFDVGGLQVPSNGHISKAEAYSAVELFVRGAERVDRAFSLATEWDHVVRICRLVDGMPLALELASAWVRALPCAEIAAELARSLDILETSSRNVQPRHRNMRVVLDGSWRLLTDGERRTFARLSVFRGGFTLDAAESVAGASRHTLAGLVDKSWLRYSSEDGRYDVQELLRQFGEEQLDATPDDAEQTHTRHSQTYMQLLRDIWPRMAGAHFREAGATVETELENIRTAWAWAAHHRLFETLDGTLQSLWFFYDRGSRFQEGEQVFARAVGELEAVAEECPALLGKVLSRQAAMLFSLDRYSEAAVLLERSIALLRPFGQTEALAFALLEYGMTLLEDEMDLDTPKGLFEESLHIYRALDDVWGIAYTLNWLGIFMEVKADQMGDETLRSVSMRYLQESLDLFRALGNAWGIAVATSSISANAYDRGEYARALELAEDSLSMFGDIDVHWGRAFSYHMMAESTFCLGRLDETRAHVLDGLRVAYGYRLVKYSLFLVYILADTEIAAGNTDRGYELLAFVDQQRLRYCHPRYAKFDHEKVLAAAQSSELRPAVERGRAHSFDGFLRGLIDELSSTSATTAVEVAVDNGLLLSPLTERERDVLRLLADGLSNRQIAEALVVALGTVKTHVHNICSKLDAANRGEAIQRARELGLV